MPSYIVYDTAGNILSCHTSGDKSYNLRPPGSLWIEHERVNEEEFYIFGGVVTLRPVMTPTVNKTTVDADDTDLVVISGLPDPCEARIGKDLMVVTGGQVEVSFDLPDMHTIEIEAPPYLKWEVEIDAV